LSREDAEKTNITDWNQCQALVHFKAMAVLAQPHVAVNALTATRLDDRSSESPKIVFAFAGEGVHAENSDMTMVRRSPAFPGCSVALAGLGIDIEELLRSSLGKHHAGNSVVLTTVINVCLCEVWKCWGFLPSALVVTVSVSLLLPMSQAC
jgi:hypothetical protein